MYTLPSYFPEEARKNVKPDQVLYKLPSYHEESNEAANEELHLFDPAKHIEKEQLAMIEKLKRFGITLDSYIKSYSESNTKTVTPENGNDKKSNKENKKESRKENKAKAVGASKDDSTKKPEKVSKASTSDTNESVWIVKEEKPSAESGQSLTANLAQKLAEFETTAAGPISLTFTLDDSKWITLLAKIGEKRSVLFVGAIRNNVANPKTTIAVSGSNEVTLTNSYGNGKVCGRLAVWKVLGGIIGLSSFGARDAIHSAYSHQWLDMADGVLSNAFFKDNLMRESAQFLSSRDSLGGHNSVCMADVVVYSLISTIANPPNNIELWARRIQTTFE